MAGRQALNESGFDIATDYWRALVKCRLRLNEGVCVLNVKLGCLEKRREEIPLEVSHCMNIVLCYENCVLFKYNRHLSIYRMWCYIK